MKPTSLIAARVRFRNVLLNRRLDDVGALIDLSYCHVWELDVRIKRRFDDLDQVAVVERRRLPQGA